MKGSGSTTRQKMKMNTLKSVLLAGLLAATLTVTAGTALVAPHWVDAQQPVASTATDVNYAKDYAGLGYVAKSRMASPARVSGATDDPNLLACAQLGKRSCPHLGTTAPCCGHSGCCGKCGK
jgi:hypothetical protein